jgi:nicotinate phosphoribosyltransferase
MAGDVLALEEEPPPGAHTESLLRLVMREGELLRPSPALPDIRRHCAGQLATLPDELKRLDRHGEYPVAVSPGLLARQERALVKVEAPRPG